MVEDIASGTAFLEVVLSDFGKAQGIIKLSKSKKTSVGGDGGTVKCQADFGVELEPERGLFAVTHGVPPGWLRYLYKTRQAMG